MKNYGVCLVLSLFAAYVSAAALVDDACVGKEDGSYGLGCRSYTNCTNGVATIIDCSPNVVNVAKQPQLGCDSPANTPPPCGDEQNCAALPDVSFPRLDDDCQSFYTCIAGLDMGTQTCNPGTVFNWIDQICDWPYNVYPPCGTKPLLPPRY